MTSPGPGSESRDGRTAPPPLTPNDSEEELKAARVIRVFDAARAVAVARDLVAAEQACIRAIEMAVSVRRAHCLFVDSESNSVWSAVRERDHGDEHMTNSGLVGWVVGNQAGLNVQRADRDPRWLRGIDDPDGSGAEALLVEPVCSHEGTVEAVLVAVRGSNDPFSQSDVESLRCLGARLEPILIALGERLVAANLLDQRRGLESLFREEAIAAHASEQPGDLIRTAAKWSRSLTWLLVALVVGMLALAWLIQVPTTIRVTGVVRVAGATDLSATRGGVISEVDVARGWPVKSGQHLLKVAGVPVVAPNNAVVTQVHVGPGATVAAGARLLTLAESTDSIELHVLIHVRDVSRVAAGQAGLLRLERLQDDRYAIPFTLDSISSEAIDAREVGAASSSGTVLVARASLPTEVSTGDAVVKLVDGEVGVAELRIGRQRLIEFVAPEGLW